MIRGIVVLSNAEAESVNRIPNHNHVSSTTFFAVYPVGVFERLETVHSPSPASQVRMSVVMSGKSYQWHAGEKKVQPHNTRAQSHV